MTFEEIVSGFRALQESDFDLTNVGARGLERLHELTEAVKTLLEPNLAIPEMFRVMEQLPHAELGYPGPLVHTLEALPGYEEELVNSVRRRPTVLSVWMVNRILNTELPGDLRHKYTMLLRESEAHPDATNQVKEDVHDFLEFQNFGANEPHTSEVSS